MKKRQRAQTDVVANSMLPLGRKHAGTRCAQTGEGTSNGSDTPLLGGNSDDATEPKGNDPTRDGDPHTVDATTSLQDGAQLGSSEEYTADEQALNDFMELHPMLSLEATTSQKTLELVELITSSGNVVADDVPVVSKSYDDEQLRPPNVLVGERPCACDDQCVCMLMAKMRHGKGTSLGFVCTEFLLPSEREAFLQGKGIPARRKKCLVCTRYYQNYLYILARTNTSLQLGNGATMLRAQTFQNPVLHDGTEAVSTQHMLETATTIPRNASVVRSADGYHPSVMLFVDEAFVDTSRAAREGSMSNMCWRPIVRFCSSHYGYRTDPDGTPRLVQIGMAHNEIDNLPKMPHFGSPLTTRVGSSEA